jgi:hypothetical protein
MKLIPQIIHDLVQNIIVIAAVATFIVALLFFWKLGSIKWPLYEIKEKPVELPQGPLTQSEEIRLAQTGTNPVEQINDYWYGGQYIPGYHLN